MSNEAKLEIDKSTKAVVDLAAAVKSLTVAQQTQAALQKSELTNARQSLSNLRAMRDSMQALGTGMAGLSASMQSMDRGMTQALKDMSISLKATMLEMSSSFSTSMQSAFKSSTEPTKRAAKAAGKEVGDAYAVSVREASARAAAQAMAASQAAMKANLLTKKSKTLGSVFDELDALKEDQMNNMFKAQEAANKRSLAVRVADSKAAAKAEIAAYNDMLDTKLKLEKIASERSKAVALAQAVDLRRGFAGEAAARTLLGLDPTRTEAGARGNARLSASAFTDGSAIATRSSVLAGAPVEVGRFGQALTDLNPKLALSKQHMNDLHSAARGLASGFGAMWLTWGNIGPLLAGAAVSHTIAGVVKQGAEVNHIMETMRVLTGQNTQEAAALNAQLLEMASNGPTGPKAIAEGMKQLALAGLKTGEVASAIKDVINLSVAGEVDMKKAADALTGIGTAFNIDARGYNYVSDVIAKTSAVSKASVESVTEAMKTASVIHKQYGVSLEDVGLGVAMLNNLNIQGTAAGTALRNMYVDLSGRTRASREAFKDLGVEVLDTNGKFKDMVTIAKALGEGLQKAEPAAQARYKQILFSERGGKPAVEMLELINTPALNKEFANRLEEIKAEMANFEGFTIQSAARLAGTASNQMKSVASAYQGALQSAFSTAEPYILSTSKSLRDMFNSPEFKEGLSSFIYGIGETLKTLPQFVSIATDVVKVLVILKATQAAATLTTIAMYNAGLALGTATRVGTATMAAQTVATGTATVAMRGYAAATGAAAVASKLLGAAAPWLGLLVTVLTAAGSAWLLYSDSKKAAFDASKDSAAANTLDAYIEKLGEENKRLDASNRAYANRVTLQQQLEADARAKTATDSDTYKLGVEKKLLKANEDLTKLPSGSPAAIRLRDEISGYETALKIQKQKELTAQWMTFSNQEKAKINAAHAKNKQAEQAANMAELKGPKGMPHEGAWATISDGSAGKLQTLKTALDKELSTLHDQNSKVSAAVDDRHRNHLISDAAFYVQKKVQDEAAYESEKHLIDKRYTDLRAASASAQALALRKLGVRGLEGADPATVEGASKNFLNMTSEELNSRFPEPKARAAAQKAQADLVSAFKFNQDTEANYLESSSKLKNAYDLAQEKSNNALAGSYRAIGRSIEELDRQMIGHHAQMLSQQAGSLVGGAFETVWDKAGREQQKNSLKKYADDIARIQEDIDRKDRQSAANLKEALVSGTDAVLEAAFEERRKFLEEAPKLRGALEAKATQSGVFAAQEGDAARKVALQNEMSNFRRDFSTGVAGAVSTAIFEGGAEGGKQLRNFLEQMFIRKPFEIVVSATMDQILGSAGSNAVGGLLNWAKGGLGGIGGGGGAVSSTTVDEYGAIVESQAGFFDGLLGNLGTLFAVAQPAAATSAVAMTSATTGFSLAVAQFQLAVSSLSAGSAAGGVVGLTGISGGIGGGGGDYSFINEAGFADVGVGFASGGQASPFSMHEVNERGTEMLTMGGRDYLMTGSQGATVTSVRDMPAAGGTIQHNIVINVDSRADQAQVQALVAGAVRQGNAQLVDQLQQSGVLAR